MRLLGESELGTKGTNVDNTKTYDLLIEPLVPNFRVQ